MKFIFEKSENKIEKKKRSRVEEQTRAMNKILNEKKNRKQTAAEMMKKKTIKLVKCKGLFTISGKK